MKRSTKVKYVKYTEINLYTSDRYINQDEKDLKITQQSSAAHHIFL